MFLFFPCQALYSLVMVISVYIEVNLLKYKTEQLYYI